MENRTVTETLRIGEGEMPRRNVNQARKRPQPLHIVVTALAIIFTVGFAWWLVATPRFEWDVVAQYVFSDLILKGVGMTLALTAICMVLGSAFGVFLALMKLTDIFTFKTIAGAFIWFFRAVPMLVQLIFWFNLSYLVPRVVVGIPFGPEFFSWNTNDLINAFTAAVIGLTIHEAVYMAEIIRSGILSVDPGQRDAARALGYTDRPIFLRFILPQALRVILPPTGSQVISLLKGTSLVSVIGMTDLLHAAQGVYNRTFEVVPLLLVASIWYLILVGILTFLQGRFEVRLSRGFRPAVVGRMKKISLEGKAEA